MIVNAHVHEADPIVWTAAEPYEGVNPPPHHCTTSNVRFSSFRVSGAGGL